MIANPEQPNQSVVTAMMVEYGSVVIGGKRYICPVKGVAFSRLPVPLGNVREHPKQSLLVTRLNDIVFTRYHLFRAEVKILPESGPNAPNPAVPAPPSTH